MQSMNLIRRLLAATAVLALAVGIGACSSGDDDQEARTESNPQGDDDDGAGSGESGTTATDSASSGDVPQDSDLDIDVVELEAYNGAGRTVQLHDATSDARSLRLVDDAGNVYSFRPPDDMENPNKILLEQGETLSGTWEFLGPLVDQPARVHLVTMVDDSQIDGVEPGRELGDDPNDDTMTSGCTEAQYICPSFAIPIELTWD
jgi:hypothetical protein